MSTLLAYQSFGENAARTILLLHGGGVAGWMWNGVVALLPDFHCLVPDLPEHGKSMAVRPFTMDLAARQAIELVREKAHGGKAIVVGLSEGAQVLVQMMATQPEVIEGAFVSSALLLPMPGHRLMRSERLLRFMFRISVPPFRANEWWMRLNMRQAAAIPDEYFEAYRENFQIINEDQFANLLLENQGYRLPEGLGCVRVPTLAVAGIREYRVMKESARRLASALPNARTVLVDLGKGASMTKEHNWAMNAPDLFVQVLRSFIRGDTLPDVVSP